MMHQHIDVGPCRFLTMNGLTTHLPGSGYSDLTEHQASIETMAAFLGRLLDALGVERAAFVASSAGGLPVLDFAIRHPERVAALVLASTCGVPHAEPLLWRLLRWPLLGEVMGLFVTPGMVRSNLRQAVYDEGLITDDVVSAYFEPLRRPGAWRADLKLERNWQPAWVEANLGHSTHPGGLGPGRPPAPTEYGPRVWPTHRRSTGGDTAPLWTPAPRGAAR